MTAIATRPLLIGALVLGLSTPAWALDCGDTTGPGATDVPCTCGDTVTTDTTLLNAAQAAGAASTADPVVFEGGPEVACPGAGLVLAPGVSLDLNRNEILGSQVAAGIGVTGDSATVTNGTISEFATGVEIAGAENSVSGVVSRRNAGHGIAVVGTLNTLTSNTPGQNAGAGIQVVGGSKTLDKNKAS